MSGEGFQITIPTFDDDEFNTATIPFGRSNNFSSSAFGAGTGFGGTSTDGLGTPTSGHGFGGGFGTHDDSPMATPSSVLEKNDRSYFHARGDSVTSDSSVHSTVQSYKSSSVRSGPSSLKSSIPTTSGLAAHSSSSSITYSAQQNRKSSFASIRNAFKGKGSEPPPPLPYADQSYPALNPTFPRSNSSLAHVNMTGLPSPRRPSVTATGGSPQARPSTPQRPAMPSGLPNSRHVPKRSASLSRQGHGHSNSSFFQSDPGSDNLSFSPPPVPKMPRGYMNGTSQSNQQEHMRTPSLTDSDEHQLVLKEPKTPAEYALHAVFTRFVVSADHKVNLYLKSRLNQEPPFLPHFVGPGVDKAFDELLDSLARLAQKQLKRVVESVLRWRSDQNKTMNESILRLHMNGSPSSNRSTFSQDTSYILRQRKALVSIYIACRALIVVFSSIHKDQLGAGLGNSLEEIIFEQFRRHDMKVASLSANHRANVEIAAQLLGYLSNVRFETVTDRFLVELKPIVAGYVTRDGDPKYENLVQGIRHIQIKVWPPEAFDEGAEFLLAISRSFERAHGFRLKKAFAETLTHLLHPIGKTAQHEVNHPTWAKAIDIIYPKAHDMMSKTRYWHAAYPLVVTSLCVAPHEFFLKHWVACYEGSVSKFKERTMRIHVLNGMMRLIWTYLYRCQESTSTTQTRLDNILKHFFPINRLSVVPNDGAEGILLHIVHFIISRHFEYGGDLALSLMQEATLTSGKQRVVNIETLAPQRTLIGFRAILLSLTAMEKDKRYPAWPSSSDFSVLSDASYDWPITGDRLPDNVMSKPGVEAFVKRLLPLVTTISRILSQTVGYMSIFDDRWTYRPHLLTEDVEPHVVRSHPEGKVAYPRSACSQIDLLITLFDSWPRCVNDKLPVKESLDMLLCGLLHVEPAVADAAARSLLRFASDERRVTDVLARFNRFLFGSYYLLNDSGNTRLFVEGISILQLWETIVGMWVQRIKATLKQDIAADSKVTWLAGAKSVLHSTEAGALFLLTYNQRHIRVVGIEMLRQLPAAAALLQKAMHDNNEDTTELSRPDIINILNGEGLKRSFLEDKGHLLDAIDRKQLPFSSNVYVRLAQSDKEVDSRLWRFVFPSFIKLCMEHHPLVVDKWRETLNAAVVRYHPLMSALAGITGRTPVLTGYAGLQEREKSVLEYSAVIEQWHFWIRALCAAATSSDSRSLAVRDHTRAASDLTAQQDRLSTAKGLFRHLTAFLASEHTIFRDSVVSAFGSIHQNEFATLLGELKPMTRHILDGRSKIVQRGQGQEHLYTSIAHIYQLTAHFVHDPRSLGDHASLYLLLTFVRETRNFLVKPDNRGDSDLHALRRYFCGVVEQVFDRMNTLKDSDRFVSQNIRLSLYRLCEEWCQIARPAENKQRRDAIPHAAEARSRAEADLELLAGAAYGAMAALCQGAFFCSNTTSTSPTDICPPEHMETLKVDALLERIIDMLASGSCSVNDSGRKALTSLLKHPYDHDPALTDAAVRWSFITSPSGAHLSKFRFFEVVVDVFKSFEGHHFSFAQIACLGLCNLGYPAVEVRRTAYNLLEALHIQSDGQLSLAPFESAIGSSAATVYLHAQRQLSDSLAQEHHAQGGAILAQCAMRLPQVYDNIAQSLHELILQPILNFLEPWIATIDLMPEGYSQLSPEGHRSLCNLFSLTRRYVDRYPDHIQALWSRLVDQQFPMNSSATVKFLLEHAARRGSMEFIEYAGRVTACLSRTPIGRRTFEDLCSVIDPAGMSQAAEPEYNMPEEVGSCFKADLKSLFPPDQPKPSLGTGELAMLFLTDVALERSWDLRHQLPVLLHALLTHLDHRLKGVAERAEKMLFQVLRAWIPGYDELQDRSKYPSCTALKKSVDSLAEEGSLFWSENDPSTITANKMARLCKEILVLLEPLHPQLRQEWGEVALLWGTACASRPIAVRSLQSFRVLMPKVNRSTLSGLLGRLSNTIADPDESIQAFTNELLLTLTALARSEELDTSLLPQYFWSAYACLSTTVEQEFAQALEMMNALLDKINFHDPPTVEELLNRKPEKWAGPPHGLQRLIINGLKSSVTSSASFKMLFRLSEFDDNELFSSAQGRLRDLFTVTLPWCLDAMDGEPLSANAVIFGERLARLAEKAGLSNLARIMISFSKSRFRTKDDFLRQTVACLRDNFAPRHWTEVATLLLSLVLNPQRWLRVKAMQVLKGLFSHRESRNPLEFLGSELLMPLLRLLQTDLASQALEVLDEPVAIAGGGPKAAQVIRMSMRMSMLNPINSEQGAVFGIPSETGWCIAQPEVMTEDTRLNIMLTYDMCRMPRPSLLIFEPEPELEPGPELSYSYDIPEVDLGDLLGRLAGLNTYFKDQGAEPSEEALQRAQAILSKSSSNSGHPETIPETPLAEQLFDVAPPSPREYIFGDSDEEELSEGDDMEVLTVSDEDSFAFDRKSRLFGGMGGMSAARS